MLSFLKTLVNVVLTNVPSTSPVGTTDKIDWAKTLRTVGLVGVAASIAEAGRQLGLYDAGVWEGTILLALTAAGELVGRLVKDNEKVIK